MHQHVERFLQELENVGSSAHTLRSYRNDLKSFAETVGELDVSCISVDLVRTWIHRLHAEKLRPSTIRRHIACLRSFLRVMKRDGRIDHNPAKLVHTPKQPLRLPEVWSQGATCGFLDAISKTSAPARDVAILELLYGTGIRIEELTSLNVADVDQAEGFLRVRGKGKKERAVPFGTRAAAALSEYFSQRSSMIKARGLDPEKEPAIFLNQRDGRRITSRGARGVVKKYGTLFGDPALHPHNFRHAFATHMLENGANLRELQEMLGHARLQTAAIYTHVSINQIRDVYERSHPHG